MKDGYNFVILAGGKGTRLGNKYNDTPKALVDINGKSILQRQIEWIYAAGEPIQIIIETSYLSDKIVEFCKDYGKIKISHSKELLGTGGAIAHAMGNLGSGSSYPTVVLNGDILCEGLLKDVLKSWEARDTNRMYTMIAGTKVQDASTYGTLLHKSMSLEKFLEKTGIKKEGLINAGIYLFDTRYYLNCDSRFSNKYSVEYDMFPFMTGNSSIKIHELKGQWFDLGTPERIKNAKKIFTD